MAELVSPSSNSVYMSVFDRQAESFIEPSSKVSNAESSLLNNLLFEENMLIPDSFFFASRGLLGHIKSASRAGRVSVLEACLANGIAIPAFRDEGCASFSEAYAVVRDAGIAGVLRDSETHQAVARLDRTMARSENFRYTHWPTESVGAVFEDNLTRFFQPASDSAAYDTPHLREIWERTGPWRYGALNLAKEFRSTGFRRGDYMAMLGQAVGAVEESKNDISHTFAALRDPSENLAMQVLCFWMNECYSYSQAGSFGVRPNFPNFHEEYSSMTLAALSSDDVQASRIPLLERSVVAKIPRKSVLLSMDPAKLVGLRFTPAALDYFAAAEYWRDHPLEEEAFNSVQSAFQTYAATIRREAYQSNKYVETLIRMRLSSFDGPARLLANTVYTALSVGAGALMGSVGLPAAPFVLAGGVAYAAFLWQTDRPRKYSHSLQANAELSMPTPPEP
ncbi:hypothetical protein [Microbispora triticiradicis]|uniref:hypothetical protein n=1 Tax=Microbispora triticiradicis TaxID=2200763 RepID=UPI001AD6FAF9|nr:hypothetical protein [Microbispora triticiradicis]MBO4269840.1 hypothetical protein [Microbispora triticiradicis]